MGKRPTKETHNTVLDRTCVIAQRPNSTNLDSQHLVAQTVNMWLSPMLPSCVCSLYCSSRVSHIVDAYFTTHNKGGYVCCDVVTPPGDNSHRQNAWGILKYRKSCLSFNFAVCVPGESGPGERAGPSDESVWRTAHGSVQGRNVQGRRSVRSCRDSTLPGALQLCRTHQSCGGKRTNVIHILTSPLTQVLLKDKTYCQQMMKRPKQLQFDPTNRFVCIYQSLVYLIPLCHWAPLLSKNC